MVHGNSRWFARNNWRKLNPIATRHLLSHRKQKPALTLVLDAGLGRGLTTASTRREVFAGLTYFLPRRLWQK